ncbi:MAG: NTE family protein [Candidatus Omnitrophota bacterium]|jgi:NTE family protein
MPFIPRKRPRESQEESDRAHQKIDRNAFLKRCPLFQSLKDWEIKGISKLARLVEIKKDEFVFHQGDDGNFFHVVVSGRFEAFTGDGATKLILAYLKQGSHFGEMSLISGKPHSASVRARSDSLVLEIGKTDFERIVQNNAAVSLEISRVLSKRLKAGNETGKSGTLKIFRSDVVAIQSLRHQQDQVAFSINLAASLRQETKMNVILIDMSLNGRVVADNLRISAKLPEKFFENFGTDLEQILSKHIINHDSGIQILNLASEESDKYTPEFVTHLINHLAIDNRFIVFDLPEEMDLAAKKIVSHSDFVFLVGDDHVETIVEMQSLIENLNRELAGPDKKVKIAMIETMLGTTPSLQKRAELFGSKDCFCMPRLGMFGEMPSNENAIMVISDPNSAYARTVKRIARKISNNLVGLALGSGAALGFAHVGVLKVLERENIPIDYISGSSMGGLVASLYSIGWSPEYIEEITGKMGIMKWLSLADFSLLPWRGLIIGKRIMKFLGQYLKDTTFEKTKIPLILVAANIHDRIVRVIKSGSISDALRASIAIPGIFQPVRINGEILIDGGVLDPLPISCLIEEGVDKIIAIDVLPTPADIAEKKRHDERINRMRKAIIAKKNIFIRCVWAIRERMKRAMIPNSIDIIVNSMQAMEHEIAETVAADADVVIRPSIPHIGWAEFHRSKELIRLGEEAAEAAIDELRAIVDQQVHNT